MLRGFYGMLLVSGLSPILVLTISPRILWYIWVILLISIQQNFWCISGGHNGSTLVESHVVNIAYIIKNNVVKINIDACTNKLIFWTTDIHKNVFSNGNKNTDKNSLFMIRDMFSSRNLSKFFCMFWHFRRTLYFLEVYLQYTLFCTLLKNQPILTITNGYVLKTLKTFTDKNTDKNIIKNLIRVFKKLFSKNLIELSILKKYFINSSLYYKTLYLKILSCKNLWFKNTSSNDFKISYINYYLKTIDKNTNMFSQKIKKDFLMKNRYNISFYKLGYFINSLNSVCKISFSIITKIIFSNTQLMKNLLSKFVISKFIFELFVNLIFTIVTLGALDLVCLEIKYITHSTFFEINQVITTLIVKYMLFNHLIHFSYCEKYE